MRTIVELAAAFGLGEAQAAALARYVDLILDWPLGNVTGLRNRAGVVGTLLGDSLALLDVPELEPRAAARWLDLGSGAGIPGIPLAVTCERAQLTLLDSASKKCAFLREAVAVAGLHGRAAIVCARSEAHGALGAAGRGAYDVVLARAVAPLAILVELGAPLLAPGGLLLASKTARAVREESAAGEAAAAVCGLASVSVRPLARSQLRDSVCAVYERVAATPERFPRRPGLAGKRPLGV